MIFRYDIDGILHISRYNSIILPATRGHLMETTKTSPKAAAAPTTRRFTLVLLVLAISFYWASLYFYVPTLGVYARTFGLSASVVGSILSMYGLWQAVVRLPVGIASDWLGRRKPFIIAGCLLSALGAVIMAGANGETGLLLGRSVTGLAAAAWVPMVVLFSSFFPAEQAVRASAILSIVNSLSRVGATAVTGSLNDSFGYQAAFFLAAFVAGLAILALLPIKETRREVRTPSTRQIGVLITRSDVLIPALLSAVGQYITWATTFGFLPILANESLHASSESISLLTSLNLFVGMGGNLVTSWIARRVGNLRLVTVAFVIMIGGTIAAALASSIPVLVAAQLLIGFGSGIGYPLLMGMSIEKVDERERATAMGLHQAVYAIGMFAGPWLSGILADFFGIPVMFGITAAGCAILAFVLTKVLKSSRQAVHP